MLIKNELCINHSSNELKEEIELLLAQHAEELKKVNPNMREEASKWMGREKKHKEIKEWIESKIPGVLRWKKEYSRADLARDGGPGSLFPPIKVQVGCAENLPYPDNSFDTVACCRGLCCMENPVKALQEMSRVLKSDGILLLIEDGPHQQEWLSKLHMKILQMWMRDSPNISNWFFNPGLDAGMREMIEPPTLLCKKAKIPIHEMIPGHKIDKRENVNSNRERYCITGAKIGTAPMVKQRVLKKRRKRVIEETEGGPIAGCLATDGINMTEIRESGGKE